MNTLTYLTLRGHYIENVMKREKEQGPEHAFEWLKQELKQALILDSESEETSWWIDRVANYKVWMGFSPAQRASHSSY